MDVQLAIVAIVIFGALAYAGYMFARKAKAFSPRSACDSDCGCSGKTKTLKSLD